MNRISSYEYYKKTIKWNNKKKCWNFTFRDERYPGVRVHRIRVEWTRSKKYLAEDELRNICDALDGSVVAKSYRFSDVVDKFMIFRKASGIAPGTLLSNRTLIDKHILPTFEHKRINQITTLEMNEFLSTLPNKTYELKGVSNLYTNNFIKKIQTHLSLIYKFAVANDYCDKNIMDTVYRVKRYEVEKQRKISKVELGDVNKVIQHLEFHDDKIALHIAIWTIVRPSEIFGFDFSDDLGHALLVRQAWNGKTKTMGPPKGGRSRLLPIVPPLRKALDEYYDFLNSNGFVYSPNDPLVGITRRKPYSTIKNRVDKAIRITGVPHFAWYDIRRSVITELLTSGNDAYIIARTAGHNEAMTTDVYAQVDINDQINSMKTLIKSRNDGIYDVESDTRMTREK